MNKESEMKTEFPLTTNQCGIGSLMKVGYPVFLGENGAFLLAGCP